MRLFIALVFALAATNSAFANNECLQNATNSELMRELDRRLSGVPGGSQSAAASFSCDSQTNLLISVVGSNGQEQEAQIYLGSSSRCNEIAQQLNSNRSRISATSIIAVCDSQTNLFRYSITPVGSLTELSKRYIGSSSRCTEEQNRINTAP
jgi:hypothetical protein